MRIEKEICSEDFAKVLNHFHSHFDKKNIFLNKEEWIGKCYEADFDFDTWEVDCEDILNEYTEEEVEALELLGITNDLLYELYSDGHFQGDEYIFFERITVCVSIFLGNSIPDPKQISFFEEAKGGEK